MLLKAVRCSFHSCSVCFLLKVIWFHDMTGVWFSMAPWHSEAMKEGRRRKKAFVFIICCPAYNKIQNSEFPLHKLLKSELFDLPLSSNTNLSFDLELSVSLFEAMPCSLFMLNLNVLSVLRHYLTPCPWATAVSLFNSPRWQKVRDCSELLSHTVSRETVLHHLLHPPALSSHSIFCLSSFR